MCVCEDGVWITRVRRCVVLLLYLERGVRRVVIIADAVLSHDRRSSAHAPPASSCRFRFSVGCASASDVGVAGGSGAGGGSERAGGGVAGDGGVTTSAATLPAAAGATGAG